MTRRCARMIAGFTYGAVLLAASVQPCGAQAVNQECAKPSETPLRRRPGAASAETVAPVCHAERMASPPADGPAAAPVDAAVPDRWRLVERFGRRVNRMNPYEGSNELKGDRPVFGNDGFVNLAASSVTLFEPRRTANQSQSFSSETLTFDAVIYRGDTVFRPPDWQWRFSPAVNYSDTRAGATDARRGVFALQGLSFEKHLRDVSPQYDFDSVRLGVQPLTSDFRGFLISDQPLAIRLFGTRDNNIFQYNLALGTRLAKDKVRLNDPGQRVPNNQFLLANVYWQDLFKPGLTSEFILALNRNRAAGPQQLLAPASMAVGPPIEAPHEYDVGYVGYALDGHVGRLNTTVVAYGLGGREQRGTFVDRSTDIRATFAAAELSADFDWRRIRLSLLHASGDGNPYDRRATGFDNLTASALFAGADSSFFFHQRLAIADSAFDLKARDGLLPSLRAAGNTGQANFTNPGLNLAGLGLDMALTPALNVAVDANQLWFDKTAVLATLLQRAYVPSRVGAEFNVNATWRPLATQNVIFRLSAAELISGPGYRAIYGGSLHYSVLATLTLTY